MWAFINISWPVGTSVYDIRDPPANVYIDVESHHESRSCSARSFYQKCSTSLCVSSGNSNLDVMSKKLAVKLPYGGFLK